MPWRVSSRPSFALQSLGNYAMRPQRDQEQAEIGSHACATAHTLRSWLVLNTSVLNTWYFPERQKNIEVILSLGLGALGA